MQNITLDVINIMVERNNNVQYVFFLYNPYMPTQNIVNKLRIATMDDNTMNEA